MDYNENYTQGGPEEDDREVSGKQNGGKKPRSKVWLYVLIGVVSAAVMCCIVVFGIKVGKSLIVNGITKHQSTASEMEKNEATVKETEKQTDETIGNNSSEIKDADTEVCFKILDVSDVVAYAMPTVVAIADTRVYTSSSLFNPYSWYFGGQSGNTKEQGVVSGSGVIIGTNETELLIVTNNHVVDVDYQSSGYSSVESAGITVEFCDGSSAKAVIKGTNADEDLAIIVVELKDLSSDTKDAIRVAVIGSSDDLKVGEGVVAIGNAGGYGQSVTTGIISAKNREVKFSNNTRTLLQTDAAINPGNSGGGLFNAKGELIGINNAKTVSTSIEGMGFAIPITYAMDYIDELVKKETIAKEDQGYLGISGSAVPESYVNYGYPEGVSVSTVSPNSPAEKAGIQVYDIITAINGKKVSDMSELKKTSNSYPAGTTVKVTFMRLNNGVFTETTVDVTLCKYSELESSTEEKEEKPTQNSGNSWSDFYDKFFGW